MVAELLPGWRVSSACGRNTRDAKPFFSLMNILLICALAVFWMAIALIVLVLVGYPLLLLFIATIWRGGDASGHDTESITSVSLLVAVRNGKDLIAQKLSNSLSLGCDGAAVEVIVVSDGSTDGTDEILGLVSDPRLTTLMLPQHHGKAAALNEGMSRCVGDVVVFSDADAVLDQEALVKLVRHFTASSVGGVCGKRVIERETAGLREAQQRYINFDSWIKGLESRIDSITSNDGKLYAVRRELLLQIPDGVTDDLFTALSVVGQGHRFLFEADALAFVPLPSRNPGHEITRRRRIVSRSLRGIWLNRTIFNPFRFGIYSFGLLINKVFRRALPLFIIAILLSSAILSFHYPWAVAVLFVQALVLALALYYPYAEARGRMPRALRRWSAISHYFLIGTWGSLLGMLDFILGKTVVKWEPIKSD